MQLILQSATSVVLREHAPLRRCRPTLYALYTAAFAVTILLSGSLQAQKPARGAKHPPAKTQNLAQKGHALFTKTCSPCHGDKGQGGEGPDIRDLKLTDQQIAPIIKAGFKGEMPAFGSRFKDSEIKALAAYVHSLKK